MQIIEKLLPGKFYHIYNRGNNRENIFIERRNYTYFLEQWPKHVSLVAETYAYCLMKNHFHFLVRIHNEMEITKLIETLNTPVSVSKSDRGTMKVDEDGITKRISKNFSNHLTLTPRHLILLLTERENCLKLLLSVNLLTMKIILSNWFITFTSIHKNMALQMIFEHWYIPAIIAY